MRNWRSASQSDAAFSAQQLITTTPAGYLAEAAYLLAADAAEAAEDWAGAARALTALAETKALASAPALLRLGRAQLRETAARRSRAKAFTRLFYEFALTPEANDAEGELARLITPGIAPSRETYALDLGRAERFLRRATLHRRAPMVRSAQAVRASRGSRARRSAARAV